jgi:[acyl-carrier-protein] S-malonyltransferase
MGKIAFIFPGQGSQEIGMGKDLFASDEYFRTLVKFASDFTGEDLEKLCCKGPEKKLIQSKYLQPLLASVSLGYLHHLKSSHIKPDVVLGHSLGEITALGASGVVDDQQTIAIAAKRGELMDAAAEKCNGTMMAVLFTPLDIVERILQEMNEPNMIALANDNAPDQVVLSGDRGALERFSEKCKAANGGKCKHLVVSGPWHSHFMKSAREQFEMWAELIAFKKPHTPLILNAIAKPEAHPSTIKHVVTWQLTSPVFWRECMETVKGMEIDTIIEIGPGRVLSGLVRVNGFAKTTAVHNVNNLRGVDLVVEHLVKKNTKEN